MKTISDVETLAGNIDRIAWEKGIRQKDLPHSLGISHLTYQRIFDNRTKRVYLSTVMKIAKALRVEVSELLTPPIRERYEVVPIPVHLYERCSSLRMVGETTEDVIKSILALHTAT